jgi:hypothetical protein
VIAGGGRAAGLDGRAGGDERHRAAIARTLSWADDAAARGEYREALAWLDTVEAVDAELPQPYVVKRAAWRRLESDSSFAA